MNVQSASEKLGKLSSFLSNLGALALFAMMVITTADVVGRYLFNKPILGVFELTEFLVLIVIFSFLAYTQSHKGHVAVDLLVLLFPKRLQLYIELFNHTICLLLMVLITWMGIVKALELMEIGETSPNLLVPNYPFVFYLVLGCAVMCIEYIRDLIRLLGSRKESSAA